MPPFAADKVDLNHAQGEGEGYASVAEWRASHEQFWHSAEMRQALAILDSRLATTPWWWWRNSASYKTETRYAVKPPVLMPHEAAASFAPMPGLVEVWAAYITAKTAAEADLRARDLDWTILRPGGLTDGPATGMIRLAAPPVPAGTVPRAGVAAVIAALLDNPGSRHQTPKLEIIPAKTALIAGSAAVISPEGLRGGSMRSDRLRIHIRR